MASSNVKIIFGGGVFTSSSGYPTPEEVEEVLKVLEEEGIKIIDTASGYGESETLLGLAGASSRFVIDTKYSGLMTGKPSSKANIIETGEESLEKLKTEKLDIYYIHGPDRNHPLEDTLAGIHELYKSGKFERFGLSNFTASEVEDVVRIAKEKNYILPSVYQGNYSAVARRTETEVVPTLRKHNIAFYAYSPIGGGFLTKSPEELLKGGKGRWDPSSWLGQMYHALYTKPGMLEALKKWGEISEKTGIPKAELAYRWIAYHSQLRAELGDGVIIGARNITQLKQTSEGLKKGPLSPEIAKQIDDLWIIVEKESPLDNFNDYLAGNLDVFQTSANTQS